MARWKIILPVIMLLSICGCSQNDPHSLQGMVCSVTVSYTRNSKTLQRTYTVPEKVDILVAYVNNLSPCGKATTNPEYLQEDRCKITLELSGGKTKTYRLVGGKYLSIDCRAWQQLSVDHSKLLYSLLDHMPGDKKIKRAAIQLFLCDRRV